MNVWGFTPILFKYLKDMFVEFLHDEGNEIRSEYLIPSVVNELIQSGREDVHVLRSASSWFGVTYKDDRPFVMEEIQKIPLVLWDKKSELTITATPKGAGTYLLVADGDSGRRLMALRNAMNKLADLAADESISEQFCFSCGHDHHDLVGMLLQSAPNVRAVMREFEMNAAKGVLLAPGSQN